MTALQVVAVLSLGFAVVMLVPCLTLFVQVAAAAASRRVSTVPHDMSRPPVAVLMPAHDEADGIAAPIAAIRAQLLPGDRLLVVADNCTDHTARIGRAAGASVVERHDPARRGKGHALDFGMHALGADAPPTNLVVVVVDADCIVAADGLDLLARTCAATGRPTQALYLMRAPAGAGLKTRIAELAWLVRNYVRPLGCLRMGMPCQLMGSGMAFPWPMFRDAGLASGHLVEDLELGLKLAAAGTPPRFCPEALVTGVFPVQEAALTTQRTRWEHGHLSMMVGTAPKLALRAVVRGQGRLLAMTLDLCVPPIASLAIALLCSLVIGAVLAALGESPATLVVAALASGLFVASIVRAWARFGRSVVAWHELLFAPLYVIGKIPIYARLLWKRQTTWVRTGRDERRP